MDPDGILQRGRAGQRSGRHQHRDPYLLPRFSSTQPLCCISQVCYSTDHGLFACLEKPLTPADVQRAPSLIPASPQHV